MGNGASDALGDLHNAEGFNGRVTNTLFLKSKLHTGRRMRDVAGPALSGVGDAYAAPRLASFWLSPPRPIALADRLQTRARPRPR